MIARDTCPHCGAVVPVPTLTHVRTDGYHVRTLCRMCRQPLLFTAVLQPGMMRIKRYQLDQPELHAPAAAASGLVYVAAPDQAAVHPAPAPPAIVSRTRRERRR